jgi:DMSO/TMAO reductase YedYZ molybdopterin-dependent catalytic subunit
MSAARLLRERRAFLVTLGAGLLAVAGRVALLPRPPTDSDLSALGSFPEDEAGQDQYDLGGSMNLNEIAAQLELGPPIFRYSRVFNINTVELHPQRGLTDRTRWSVTVDGLVGNSFSLTPQMLDELPPYEVTSTFHCVEGWGVPNARWRGVQLREVLSRARIGADASFVGFHSMSGVYADSLSLEQAMHPETLLATHLDDQPLSDRQGYPIRLVVPFMYGYKSVKWLARISVENRRYAGFWERRGWQLDPYV